MEKKHKIYIRRSTYRKSNPVFFIKYVLVKIHDVLISLFRDSEDKKEYDPGDLGIHNLKMFHDSKYKRSYYLKCLKHRLRYEFINFLVNIILTIIVLTFLILLSVTVGIVTYMLMLIFISPKSFSKLGLVSSSALVIT